MPVTRRRKPVWDASNLVSSEGVEVLLRRGPDQQGDYAEVDPQPKVMIVIVDESDPHPNEKNSTSVTYGVLYVLRTDDVHDKDVFWFQPPGEQRFRWGVVGVGRWNIDNALDGVNYGVKQYRIRKGG